MCGWRCGGRDTKTLDGLYRELPWSQIAHYYTDHYSVYKELLPRDKYTASKRYTVALERNNGQQRHWLGRFRRKSLIVTQSVEMLNYSLALFTRYRVNGSIDELISLVR